MKTTQPRKQRLNLYNTPLHKRKQLISAHLSPELRARYGTRSLPVRKGDTVKILKGEQKGKEGKVAGIEDLMVTIDGITRSKTNGTKVFIPIKASTLLVTEIDLSDAQRKKALDRKGKTKPQGGQK
jgi:large subunit ribosomal protein L24